MVDGQVEGERLDRVSVRGLCKISRYLFEFAVSTSSISSS